jgi:two-component system, chemotaxis family, protein-glutamate methylesterase/glutaminase
MSAIEMVVMGASLGGLEALQWVLSGLSSGFPAAVAIVQHRLADVDSRLVILLRKHSHLPVSEPEDKEPIRAGHVYLAPSDYHLLVEPGTFALSTEGPVNFARPSVDVLFESAADVYGERLLGVVLTGASEDGAAGAVAIKRRGGTVLVQDPATALSPVSPRAAIERRAASEVVPLERMAARIAARCVREAATKPQ